MITEDINLQELALRKGGPEEYSKARAKCFHDHYRKAKSQLNRSIVLNLTKNLGPFQMASNVMHGVDGPMTLHHSLSHLGTIEELRQLFYSDKLYLDDKVHKLWVGLFASGVVYGCKRAGPKDTLDLMVDVDYEAHARYEMYSRLSCQGWKYGYTADALAERSANFRKVRKLVRLDRLNNLKTAEANRLNLGADADAEDDRAQALGSGGLADTTDDEDDF
jgi:hypothetical protein